MLIDPDTIEPSNLNRVVGSAASDVGSSKTDVAARLVRTIRPSALIQRAEASVLRNDTAKLLLDTDVFFCCTDSHGSRAVLNQLSYQYFLPGFDIGAQITVEAGRVKAFGGRVQMLSPGLSCLVCGGILDPETVRRDLMSDFERRADPYIIGGHLAQPSVISLNSTVCSLCITMFLSAAVGVPAKSRYQIYRAESGSVRAISNEPVPNCVVCSEMGAYGRGDRWQQPGRLK